MTLVYKPLRLPPRWVAEAEELTDKADLFQEILGGEPPSGSAVLRAAMGIGLRTIRRRVLVAERLAKAEAKHTRTKGAVLLERWRRAKKLSTEKAGRQVGRKKSAWRPWETGERRPEPSARKRLEKITGIKAALWERPA